ncbi:MAG TPA: PAS domain S-box protein [Gemmatimonadaceae bacterium]
MRIPPALRPARGARHIARPHRGGALLRASEERYRLVVETAHEGICTIDREGRITYANARLGEMLGLAAAALRGRQLFEFMEPAAAFAARTRFARRQRGIAEVTELELRAADGRFLATLESASSIIDESGDFAGAVCMYTDITRRRVAERQVDESEARYAHVAANVPGLVYRWVYRPDGSGGYTFVSEGSRTVFGVAPEEAIADPGALLDLIHPHDRPGFLALARDAAETLAPLRWEGRVFRRGGEERFIQVAARAERLADGSVVSDGLVMDVTELHDAARRLHEREQHFQSLFENNPDAVFLVGTDGRFQQLNPAAHGVIGWQPEELAGREFQPLIWPDDLPVAIANFGRAVHGEARRYEISLRHRDGRRVPAAITLVPIFVQGAVVGVFGIAKDLTGQRDLEAQLRQALKMEAVGRLAGGIAHDFNNLLTVITSYTQMALGELEPRSGPATDLAEVQRAANRAAALTRQLLAFSRQQVLVARRLDVNALVEGMVGMLRRLIGEDIALRTHLDPSLWAVEADAGQLEQVLMNLAVNARDAMPDGGSLSVRTGNVRVTAGRDPRRPGLVPGEYMMLEVEDDGVGMDPAILPNIFEPFFTTRSVGRGTGLGLAMVYGIVKQSGGYVYADSAPGEGSRFTLLLPRTRGDAEAGAGPEAAEDATPRTPPRGTERVLLVEDDDAVRHVATRMLGALGYAVVAASGGEEAMRLADSLDAQGTRVELVLTDMVMPGMSGRAVADRLTARWPGTRVLLMSGYTDDEILRRGLGDAGLPYLEKPFSVDQLAGALRAALDSPAG